MSDSVMAAINIIKSVCLFVLVYLGQEDDTELGAAN